VITNEITFEKDGKNLTKRENLTEKEQPKIYL